MIDELRIPMLFQHPLQHAALLFTSTETETETEIVTVAAFIRYIIRWDILFPPGKQVPANILTFASPAVPGISDLALPATASAVGDGRIPQPRTSQTLEI